MTRCSTATSASGRRFASSCRFWTDAGARRSTSGAGRESLLVVSREDAIVDLARFMSRYPRKTEGSDVPERFWRVYSRHVQDMAESERWFDLAALHETVWNRKVRRAVNDATVLTYIAQAYDQMGLPDRAIVVLRDAVSVLVSNGNDDATLVYELARLYEKVGRWQDGIDSLDYLARLGVPEGLVSDAALLRAHLLIGKGDREAAAQELRRVAQMPGMRDADARTGLHGRGCRRCGRKVRRCGAAVHSAWGRTVFRAASVVGAVSMSASGGRRRWRRPGCSGGGGPDHVRPRRTVRQLARCGRIELAGRGTRRVVVCWNRHLGCHGAGAEGGDSVFGRTIDP